MKQKLVLILLLFCFKAFSQNSKFNFEANYPIAIDNNFIGRNFNGIIDLGLKYRFSDLEIVDLGVSLNAGVFKNTIEDIIQPFDVFLFVIQPRLFAELNLESISKFHPFIGLGYTVINSNARGFDSFNSPNRTSETQSGFNVNLGFALDVSDALYAQIQYDFTKINLDTNTPDIVYNTNVNILKIGLGYRL
ncbi:outer membrane beta-barrel protein [uncultured Algibacter sp.]|uniref:outer membrane beta-barrel protein n=1 Tax=uncultured Algibacter sp. TaxID=298659 RepID=UPI00262D0702|nr:outer membrane beta-barrel protein [uncultured Algibacter sp.]